MQSNSFSTTILVNATPSEAFRAINNPRAWWSQETVGDTDHLGAEFRYHYLDVHRAKFRITEFVPDQKVVWHVDENYFNFVKDPSEWVNTDIVFELTPKGDQTEIRFTHSGLVPEYECYDVCSGAWGTYVAGSLKNLIDTGEGQPNPIESVVQQARAMSERDYTVAFTVEQTSEQVFDAIDNVRGWWTENTEGPTFPLGVEFTVRFGDIHLSTQKVTEWVPHRRIVWHVTEGRLNFTQDPAEWTGTDIIFDIRPVDGGTELRFTHAGLIPAIECYDACSDAWGGYINGSLRSLITTGKGEPAVKEPAGA